MILIHLVVTGIQRAPLPRDIGLVLEEEMQASGWHGPRFIGSKVPKDDK
jgi:hypothetical protein